MVESKARKSPVNVIALSRSPTFLVDVWAALEGTSDIHLCACARESTEVFQVVRNGAVDLAILDLSMEWTTICLVVSSLARQSVPTLVVGDRISATRGLDILRSGASAMLDRQSSRETLVPSIRAIVNGNAWVSRNLQQSMLRLVQAEQRTPRTGVPEEPSIEPSCSESMHWSTSLPADPLLCHLTVREAAVLGAAREGRRNQEIAESLGIGVRTVKHHLTNIFRKCGVRNRTELVGASMSMALSSRI